MLYFMIIIYFSSVRFNTKLKDEGGWWVGVSVHFPCADVQPLPSVKGVLITL